MKRCVTSCVAALGLALVAAWPATAQDAGSANDYASVKAALLQAWDAHETVQYTFEVAVDAPFGDDYLSLEGTGVTYARKASGSPYRVEYIATEKADRGRTILLTILYDGDAQHLAYELSESDGTPVHAVDVVSEPKVDVPVLPPGGPRLFELLEGVCRLNVVTSSEASGEITVEAIRKAAFRQDVAFDRVQIRFDRATGVQRELTFYEVGNQVLAHYTNQTPVLNGAIAEDRFTFEAPAGYMKVDQRFVNPPPQTQETEMPSKPVPPPEGALPAGTPDESAAEQAPAGTPAAPTEVTEDLQTAPPPAAETPPEAGGAEDAGEPVAAEPRDTAEPSQDAPEPAPSDAAEETTPEG